MSIAIWKKNIEKYFVMNVMNYFLIVVHSRYILESNMFSMAFALSRRFSFELRHNIDPLFDRMINIIAMIQNAQTKVNFFRFTTFNKMHGFPAISKFLVHLNPKIKNTASIFVCFIYT